MPHSILLVEDNLDWRQLAAAALEEAGFKVAAVSGAAEALLQPDDSGFTLIILDLDLGGENGLMLMKHLKRHHPHVPILICTGMEPSEAAVARMCEQGATRFFKKSTMQELIQAVKQAITGESHHGRSTTTPDRS